MREKNLEILEPDVIKALEQAVEQAGIWCWIYDWEKDTAYLNKRSQQDLHLGKKKKKFIEELFETDIIDKKYKSVFIKSIEALKEGKKQESIELSGVKIDGIPHWVQFMIRRMESEDGTATKAVCTAKFIDDIKELQKKYEVEKKKSEDDDSLMAYAVFNLSKNQTIEMERKKHLIPLDESLTMNAFCKDIEKSILSESDRVLFSNLFSEETLIEAFKAGKDEMSLSYERILPNGKVIWVKSSFHIIIEPQEKDLYLFYYCNDINIEKALNYMTSFIASEDYDMLGYVNFYDDSAIMLYGKNSSFGKNYSFLSEENYSESLEKFVNMAVVPEERDRFKTDAFLEKIHEELKINNCYEFVLHVQDSEGVIYTKKLRYFQFGKNPEVCIFSQRDITEIIRQEELRQNELNLALQKAETANQSKTSFLSQMSYEIRTPMNAIIGMTRLAQETTMSEETRDYIDKIKNSSEYLLDVLNDILDMSRIESGKFELHPEWTSANKMICTCMDILSPEMARKKIEFDGPERDYDNGVEFFVDPLRMKQILMNLINNAIKFTPEGGKISLSIISKKIDESHKEDYVTITDTGCGMSEEFLKRIFRPFEQEGNPYSGIVQGTGLGLALVKKIITAMEGEISVESELGKGSAFSYRIPYQYRTISIAQQSENETKKIRLDGKRILLVDDHPLNREIAAKLLKKKGVTVEEAMDGQDAVDKFRNSKEGYYDAILMDIRMPKLTGLQATEKIREMSRKDAVSVPIIAMTANAFDEDVKMSKKVGMNAHLSKPIEPRVLFETLEKEIHIWKE